MKKPSIKILLSLLMAFFISAHAIAQQKYNRELNRNNIQVRRSDHKAKDAPGDELDKEFDQTVHDLQFQNNDDKDSKKKNSKEMKTPSYFSNFVDGVQSAMIKKMVENNPLRKMSHEELKAFFKKQMKGSKFEPIFEKSPKFLDFLVGMVKHPTALSKLVSIMDRKADLLTYTYGFIIILILAAIANVFMFAKAGIFKRILFKLSLMFITPAANLALFCFFFRENLKPTFEVIKQYVL